VSGAAGPAASRREDEPAAGEPARRVVLLGASNLTLGFPQVIDIAGGLLGGPLEVLAAIGHGRSYGIQSTVLARSLPGITGCGLWDALRASPGKPTSALLTDVGNDILYGVDVPTIGSWVEWCLDRLLDAEARVVVTLLPMGTLEKLTPLRYTIARRVFFPRSRLSMALAMEQVQELNARVRDLAVGRGLPVAEFAPEWYGFDPIHIRLRHRSTAWTEILSRWGPGVDPSRSRRSGLGRRIGLRLLQPQRWWMAGFEMNRPQPCARFRDGSTIALY
jgi:hypothetical protein